MNSKKFVLLFCLVLISLADDCANPLMGILKFTGEDTPITIAAPQYCSYLEKQQSCCSVNRLKDVQDNVDNHQDDLLNVRHDRDNFYQDFKDHDYSDYDKDLNSVNDKMDDILKNNPTLASSVKTKFPDPFDVIPAIKKAVDQMASKWEELKAKRTQCFKTMLDIQASTYCLACDPKYASMGVNSDGSINLSPATCTRIKTDCYDYLTLARQFSITSSMKRYSGYLSDFEGWFEDLDQGDNDVLDQVQNKKQDDFKLDWTPGKHQQELRVPPDCTSAQNCDWLCNNFYSQGQLNNDLLGDGGYSGDVLTKPEIMALAAEIDKVYTATHPPSSGGRLLQQNVEENGEEVVEETTEKSSNVLVATPVAATTTTTTSTTTVTKTTTAPTNVWDPVPGESGATIEVQDDSDIDDGELEKGAGNLALATAALALVTVFVAL